MALSIRQKRVREGYFGFIIVDPVLEIKDKVTKNAISGETFVFECKAYGFPTPVAHFLNGSKPIADSPRVTFKSINESDKTVTINGTIRIQPVEYGDAGKYTCFFDTPEKSKVEFEINVKDKFAAMWPFLGICAEVAILCIIIFIYEKRRSKKEAAKEAAAAPEEVDKLLVSPLSLFVVCDVVALYVITL
ncbi:hypothetical protein HELRODRAFT_163621 [Helobdella robusta]|uniref:Ig-like domain-containing protein n=1 Tax=Helobdella robusta TaxID=6412 RepID=T1EUA5_HELRO|nr:hypothetical protein HELRODRAFT_163621 [Helobdella robusta]ESN96547.1 hypothetical protein HELRODRAFT_163621 [Helobdella robusta]